MFLTIFDIWNAGSRWRAAVFKRVLTGDYYYYYFKQSRISKQNESDTFLIDKPATNARSNAMAAAIAADDAYATDDPPRRAAAIWLEPRNFADDASAIDASKFRSPGWLKVQGTTGAPPIGLCRKLAKGLLLAGPIQARKGARLQCLPSNHQR